MKNNINEPKLIKGQIDQNGGLVLIETGQGFNIWMDVFEEEDGYEVAWNKFIFNKNIPLDMKIQRYQESTDNFEDCASLAMDYYEKNK